MLDNYRKYYKEMFNVYSEDMFKKMWGKTKDENGTDYTLFYLFKLRGLADEFSDYLVTLDKYNMEKTVSSIGDYLLHNINSLGYVKYSAGAYEIAESMVNAINNRLSMREIEHPLKSVKKACVDAIVDGDKPLTYLLIQEDGYIGGDTHSRVIACSKYKGKLETMCDDRVRRLSSKSRFTGYHEREGCVDGYRQLVDETRKLVVTWKIEEVLEVY